MIQENDNKAENKKEDSKETPFLTRMKKIFNINIQEIMAIQEYSIKQIAKNT